MPTRAAVFIERHFTNADRRQLEQNGIHEKGLWIMARLQRAALRVRDLEPLILSLAYLNFDAFHATGKYRGEIVYLCREALSIAKGSRRRPLLNAEEWAEHTLDSLLKKKLLRVSGNRIVTTARGDTKIAAIEAGRSARQPMTERVFIRPIQMPRATRGKPPEWLPVALNLLNDGMPEPMIARHVGIAKSTLSENRHWRDAKKIMGIPRQRQKRFGNR